VTSFGVIGNLNYGTAPTQVCHLLSHWSSVAAAAPAAQAAATTARRSVQQQEIPLRVAATAAAGAVTSYGVTRQPPPRRCKHRSQASSTWTCIAEQQQGQQQQPSVDGLCEHGQCWRGDGCRQPARCAVLRCAVPHLMHGATRRVDIVLLTALSAVLCCAVLCCAGWHGLPL
jgi:hypothetical protein